MKINKGRLPTIKQLKEEIEQLIKLVNLNCSVEDFKDKVDWECISKKQKLSEEFIGKFKDKVDWECISIYQKLSEEFIGKFKDKVNWGYISIYQKLSEEFIEKFKDEVNWGYISIYQKLSEEFIEKFKDEVNWGYISKKQKLSEEFIEKFKDEVNWGYISIYQKLSEEFIGKFKDKVYLEKIKDSWAYKTTQFKKKQIKKCGKYECYKDHFIAYKGVKSDRNSKFNFQYKYLDGKTYESFADYSSNENSFGLSVWTYEQAKDYCGECVLKVKVRYEDVARLVHENSKVRTTKIKIVGEVK